MRTLFTPLAALLFGAVVASPLLAQPVSPAEYYSRANPPPADPRIEGLTNRVLAVEAQLAAQDATLKAILAAVTANKDPVPRAVTVPGSTSVAAVQESFAGYSVTSGACANGACAAPSSFTRRGLFGWRR